MINFEDLKAAELGKTFPRNELRYCCKRIYGGVSWPGKHPGFALVVAMDKRLHFDSHDVCLLAEFESASLRDVVRECGLLDLQYVPEEWIGDYKNDAADRFIQEMNEQKKRRGFTLTSTSILNMENPYPYILDVIKTLLDAERRQLFLKDSKILEYLSESTVEPGEIASLQFGDYPAIEALAFAVMELRDAIEQENKMPEKTYRYDFDPLDTKCL
jgi:hypothetical protein